MFSIENMCSDLISYVEMQCSVMNMSWSNHACLQKKEDQLAKQNHTKPLCRQDARKCKSWHLWSNEQFVDLGKHFQNEPLFTAIGVDIDENNTSKVWGSPSSLPPYLRYSQKKRTIHGWRKIPPLSSSSPRRQTMCLYRVGIGRSEMRKQLSWISAASRLEMSSISSFWIISNHRLAERRVRATAPGQF